MKHEINRIPLISVIIPVYNVAPWLDRCLTSVVTQTETNLEIILVDDGATDGSAQICDAWAEKDSRITVIHQNNAGAAAARNRGLDIAKGDFIMFADADDYLDEAICATMLHEINSPPPDVDCVICGLTFVNEDGPCGSPQAVEKTQTVTGMDALKDRYIHGRNRLNIVTPWGKLFNKSIWSELRFSDGLYYEDLDICPYVFTKCRNVKCIPDIGYFYYQRTDSASHSGGTDDKRYLDSVAIREKHIAFYRAIGEEALSASVLRMLLDLIMTSACNGWIPEGEKRHSKQIFWRYLKEMLCLPGVPAKEKARCLLFGILGARWYKLIARCGK